MKQESQPPVVTEDGRSGTTETHPAYAQIRAGRVSTSGGRHGGAILYGSDFPHNHYVVIAIAKSELHRDLSRDWPHAREDYIEVSMSEAQWASFVSSLNMGTGTQCTLTHLRGEDIPSIPDPPARKDQFAAELLERFQVVNAELAKLRQGITESGLSGKKAEALTNILDTATRNLTPNLKFVGDQFVEHMETVTERAKIEVGAYITAAIHRAGVAALNGTTPIQLGGKKDDAAT